MSEQEGDHKGNCSFAADFLKQYSQDHRTEVMAARQPYASAPISDRFYRVIPVEAVPVFPSFFRCKHEHRH